MSGLPELLEREDIRELLTRYVAYADSGKVEAMLELFTADAVMEASGAEPCYGHAEIRQYFETAGSSIRTHMRNPYLRHHLSSIRVDFVGDGRARSTGYFLAITELGPDHWGRYRDQLVKVDSNWRIERRLLEIEGGIADGWFTRHMADLEDSE